MVLRLGEFGYGRLVHEAFDAHVLMLLQTCSKLACSLADVHLSTGTRHFVHDVCLLLPGEEVLDLSEERMEGGSGLEHHSDVEVPTHPPYLLINASNVREVHGQWVASPAQRDKVVYYFSKHLLCARGSFTQLALDPQSRKLACSIMLTAVR